MDARDIYAKLRCGPAEPAVASPPKRVSFVSDASDDCTCAVARRTDERGRPATASAAPVATPLRK